MKIKTALISGGTSGVGLSITVALANSGYNVFFIGTNEEVGEKLANELISKGNSANFIKLDLSDLQAVSKFINSLCLQIESLDLLVNVAGVVLPKRKVTKEGLEKTFAIGYFSAYLLSVGLVPILEKAKEPRIVNVSGGTSIVLKERLDFDDLQMEKGYSGLKASFAAVHAKTVLTQILSEKYFEKKIDVNSFHPGAVKSNLTRNMPGLLKIAGNIANVFLAQTSLNGIYVCTSEKIRGVSGKLFVNKKSHDIEFKRDYCDKLLNYTQKLIEKLGINPFQNN